MKIVNPMNNKLAISAIALIAIVMGMSIIVPILPQAEAARGVKVISILGGAEPKGPHPKCYVEYDDGDRIVQTPAKHTNSKGIAIFPIKTTVIEETVVSATCTDKEGNSITGRETLQPGDEIVVILMPSPG